MYILDVFFIFRSHVNLRNQWDKTRLKLIKTLIIDSH